MSLDISHLSSLVLVVGLSGAGKSTASNVLADLSYYSLDGIPVELFTEFLELSRKDPEKYSHCCLLVDARTKQEVEQIASLYKQLKGPNILLVYLESDPSTLIRRFSETRRPHPGFDPEIDKTLQDAIERERSMLTPMRELATSVISTTGLSPHDLKRELKSLVDSFIHDANKHVRVNFVSFGFKYGIPQDCDLVADVRFLPNPYFVKELRPKTGLDEKVSEYVLSNPKAVKFIEQYSNLLNFLLPEYAYEGKAYVNIGIGCTGGRHRSTAIVEKLSREIDAENFLVSCKHRDVHKALNT